MYMLWPNLVTGCQAVPEIGVFSSTFGLVTDVQTESDAYEPMVHGHRWAQIYCDMSGSPCLSKTGPWPRVLSLPGARVVCWRPHPADT